MFKQAMASSFVPREKQCRHLKHMCFHTCCERDETYSFEDESMQQVLLNQKTTFMNYNANYTIETPLLMTSHSDNVSFTILPGTLGPMKKFAEYIQYDRDNVSEAGGMFVSNTHPFPLLGHELTPEWESKLENASLGHFVPQPELGPFFEDKLHTLQSPMMFSYDMNSLRMWNQVEFAAQFEDVSSSGYFSRTLSLARNKVGFLYKKREQDVLVYILYQQKHANYIPHSSEKAIGWWEPHDAFVIYKRELSYVL